MVDVSILERQEAENSLATFIYFLLLGCGALTPWNSLVSAVDFFSTLFSQYDVADAFAIANFSASLFFFLLQLKWFRCFQAKAYICLFLYFAVLSFPMYQAWRYTEPFQEASVDQALQFALLVGLVGVAGGAGAGLQTVFFSLSGQVGSTYTGAFMNGQAVAGLLTSTCRILSKVWFDDLPPFDALRTSSIIYFISSLVVVLLCTLSFFSLLRMPMVRQSRSHAQNLREDALDDEEREILVPEEGLPPPPPPASQDASVIDVFRKVHPSAIGVLFVFWLTISLFPGITTKIPCAGQDDRNWMPILLIAMYNVGDLAGRVAGGHLCYLLSERFLLSFAVLRVALIPLFLLLQRSPLVLAPFHNESAFLAVCLLVCSSSSPLVPLILLPRRQYRMDSRQPSS
uniref:Uncharacterized protein n=1 Tax=Guillardia theta TaxID=55529 RepID=A0A7S4L2M1_GUITH|mmetsp:Transcript_3621/g.12852  ORF Transcript_3621/g.12852 Transcript_3621/m.12852 type:complete len:400 (+) Transcript_3621:89-1288(+)